MDGLGQQHDQDHFVDLCSQQILDNDVAEISSLSETYTNASFYCFQLYIEYLSTRSFIECTFPNLVKLHVQTLSKAACFKCTFPKVEEIMIGSCLDLNGSFVSCRFPTNVKVMTYQDSVLTVTSVMDDRLFIDCVIDPSLCFDELPLSKETPKETNILVHDKIVVKEEYFTGESSSDYGIIVNDSSSVHKTAIHEELSVHELVIHEGPSERDAISLYLFDETDESDEVSKKITSGKSAMYFVVAGATVCTIGLLTRIFKS